MESDIPPPALPINAAQPEPVSNDNGAGGMMARFAEMKAAENAATAPASPAPTSEVSKVETTNPAPSSESASAPDKPERAKWGELKKKAEDYDRINSEVLPAKEKELAELKAKLESAPQVDVSRYEKQIAEKEAAIADYEKRMALFDIRESPQYQQEVGGALIDIGKRIDRVAATYGANAQAIKDAFTIGDPRAQREILNDLMVEFDPEDRVVVRSLLEKSQEVFERAAYLEQNAAEVKKDLDWTRAEEDRKSKEQRQQVLSTTAKAVQKQFMETLPDVFKDDTVAQRIFAAQITDDPTMGTYNAYAGLTLPVIVAESQKQAARIKELEGELAARANLSPKPSGDNGHQPPTTTPQTPQGDSIWSRWKSLQAQGG